jgi:nitrous oxide reductase accessory protein NosL
MRQVLAMVIVSLFVAACEDARNGQAPPRFHDDLCMSQVC